MKKQRIQSLLNNINTEIINLNHKKSLSLLKPKSSFQSSSLSSNSNELSSSKEQFKVNAVLRDSDEIYNINTSSFEKNIIHESEESLKHSSLKKIETEGNPIPLKRQKEIEIINKILKNEQDLVDNDYETNEYFIKLKLDDFYTAYLTLFSIATGIIYHDISQQPDFPAKEIIRKCNIFLTSVFVFLFILCSLTRFINLLNLDKSNNMILKTTSFWSFPH